MAVCPFFVPIRLHTYHDEQMDRKTPKGSSEPVQMRGQKRSKRGRSEVTPGNSKNGVKIENYTSYGQTTVKTMVKNSTLHYAYDLKNGQKWRFFAFSHTHNTTLHTDCAPRQKCVNALIHNDLHTKRALKCVFCVYFPYYYTRACRRMMSERSTNEGRRSSEG